MQFFITHFLGRCWIDNKPSTLMHTYNIIYIYDIDTTDIDAQSIYSIINHNMRDSWYHRGHALLNVPETCDIAQFIKRHFGATEFGEMEPDLTTMNYKWYKYV